MKGVDNSRFDSCRQALQKREISSVELTRESLKRARASQALYNPYMEILEERALASAARADVKRAELGSASEAWPLLGMPVAVKDLLLVEGAKCTASSRILENFVAPYTATAVARLEAQGAVVIAKTALDEFGMGSSNENSAYGPVKNPLDPSKVPGGSSGGSAAALAAGDVALGLGTDTGGSVRQPAAFCGITGLKPTYGRVSRYGLMAFASSLDQIGPMARDAEGCAALLQTMAGFDAHDATSARAKVPECLRELAASRANSATLKGLRIGIPKELDGIALEPQVALEFDELRRHLASQGADVVSISLPHFPLSLPTYYVICTAEASSNLSRYDGIHIGRAASGGDELGIESLYARARGEGFGPEVRLRVLLGTYALSAGYYDAYYRRAAQVRRLLHRDFSQAFKTLDLILTPTAPESAFALGSRTEDPLKMYASDLCTLPASLAGVPAISFPTNFSSPKLPVGMQLMAPWFCESKLLQAVDFLQHQGVGGLFS